ncbi:MAG TPA: rhodanese-like domain-containing protein [Terracidiphilus sp.]
MRRTLAPLCTVSLVLLITLAAGLFLRAQGPAPGSSALSIPQAQLLQPEELVRILKVTEKEKPTLLQVGSRVMFSQVHIPGSEFAGPGSTQSGIQSLEDTVSALPKNRRIILYCGCCPWDHCPNVGPAYKRLHELGFTNVKVLYLAHNFGDDWVSKGYPAVKGK